MLRGSELLAKVKSLPNATRAELARECGYFSVHNGKERLNYTSFFEAMLVAKGIPLTQEKRKGRTLTYKTRVQADGKLIVGSAYLEKMDLSDDTSFNIDVGRRRVVLTAVTAQ